MSKNIEHVSIAQESRILRNQLAPKKKKETFSKEDGTISTAFVLNPSIVSIVPPAEPTAIKEESKMHRRRSIIKEFSLTTSTHGLPGIARSESVHNRIFWSISFVCFTGVMIYFVTKAILSYFDYPTRMDVNIVSEWSQYFPAVSICNSAPLRLDRFFEPFINYTNVLMNSNNSYNTSTIPINLVPFIPNFILDTLNTNGSLESFFYSLPSMLYKCTFNSIPCSADNFIRFTSATYGLCYTFNAKMDGSNNNSVRHANQDGGDGVLEMELYVHSYQYVPYLWKSAGIVALIHDNTELPRIETAGILLAPGQQHKLGYKKKTTYLLPAPYTKCTGKVPLPMEIMYDSQYHGAEYGYAETVCYQICEQTYAYERCGCVSPYLWNARSIVLPGTNKIIVAPVCRNSIPSCFSQAIDTLLNSPSLVQKYCSDCSQQCTITNFIVQKSALASPLEWQMYGIKTFVENSTVTLPSDWSTAWSTYVQKNYLSLSVIRETNIVENTTQTAQFGLVDVLSNIGGQTGLWIGISFLSLMEFTEMVYRLIRYQCHLLKLSLRRKKQIMPR